jgi:hypothetical protein
VTQVCEIVLYGSLMATTNVNELKKVTRNSSSIKCPYFCISAPNPKRTNAVVLNHIYKKMYYSTKPGRRALIRIYAIRHHLYCNTILDLVVHA